jgi:acyl-CoA oxidase
LLDPLLQIEAYEARVCAILLLAGEAVGEDAKDGGMAAAMMKNGVLLGRLSRAHCQLVLLKRFHEAVARQEERLAGGGGGKEEEGEEEEGVVTVGPAEVRVLRELCHLFALSGMEREMADFRARDYLSSRQAEMVGREVGRLNRVIRTEAVSLVDAWMMSDKLLGSALGRRDGRVYGALFEEALKSPLNEREVSEAYELHWRRLLLAGGGGGVARL